MTEQSEQRKMSLENLEKTEWCDEFEIHMRNRLLMGAFRYRPIAEQNFEHYDIIGEMKKRINKYEQTRNLEHLIDVGNFALLAFVNGRRHGEKIISIDDGEHTKEIA
jgi:hypothetical protein